MSVSQKSKSKSSSRGQIGINGVRDGVLILPHNRYRVVLEVSSLNFELKSESEQDAIIDTYESFLNSVGSSLQILIRTREIDMDKYLSDLSERLDGENEPIYNQQLKHYNEFIKSLIRSNKILTRRFYIVIPHAASKKADFDLIKEQLSISADVVVKGMARLGMQARQLSSIEVLDLFYSFYNPQQAKIQPLTERALNMIYSSMVQKERKDNNV
jgi:hypothetical protein